MRRLQSIRSTVPALDSRRAGRGRALHLLALTTALVGLTSSACKSEIDDKQKAKVEAVDDKAEKDTAEKDTAEKDTADKDTPAGEVVKLDAASSKLGFIGAKMIGDHKGSFPDVTGEVSVVDGKVTALQVEAKMASMVTDDEDLTGHLLGPDFFDAQTYPTASFKTESVVEKSSENGTHEVVGVLELHGKANKITFAATLEVSAGEVVGKAEFQIDRKLWGIDYAGKADNLIKDEVALELDLHFPR